MRFLVLAVFWGLAAGQPECCAASRGSDRCARNEEDAVFLLQRHADLRVQKPSGVEADFDLDGEAALSSMNADKDESEDESEGLAPATDIIAAAQGHVAQRHAGAASSSPAPDADAAANHAADDADSAAQALEDAKQAKAVADTAQRFAAGNATEHAEAAEEAAEHAAADATSAKEAANAAAELAKSMKETAIAAGAWETTTVAPLTGAEITGVSTDDKGDLASFLCALLIDIGVIVALLVVFTSLRYEFPNMYSFNALCGRVQYKPGEETGFGWYAASLGPNVTDITRVAGLDPAMMIEYHHFGMRMMVLVGVPLILIGCPMFLVSGGGAAGADKLSKISMRNVLALRHDKLWIYYMIALFVWYVVLAATWLIFSAQKNFMPRRFEWLRSMDRPRANTVLVENIPQQYCTDVKIKEYFTNVFGHDVVEKAYIVRDTSQLLKYVEELKTAQHGLDEAAFTQQRSGEKVFHRSSSLEHLGEEIESIPFYSREVEQLRKLISVERERIRKITADNGQDEIYQAVAANIYSRSGFVTFKNRRDSEMAVKLRLTPDDDEFVVSSPPDPSDVIYYDLQIDEPLEAGRETLGYACIAGLFWSYLPVVLFFATVTSQAELSKRYNGFAMFMDRHSGVASAWDGVVGVLVLTLFMSYMPTFLSMIFYRFFALKAEAWLQVRIQQWCFYFLVIFVLLITAIGQKNFTGFLGEVVSNPLGLAELLASTLPGASHFYLNYFAMQWVATVLVLLRYVPLSKYMALRAVVSEDRARELSEPEDQDYYGMGFRSATASLMMTVALVYCTLCPLICIMGFLFFAICRVVYGYLMVFAESIKPDLGGVFWCQQLKHTQQGLFIYATLMTGVLLDRAPTYGPGVLSALSFVWLIPAYIRFDHKFHWETLPFEDILKDEDSVGVKRRPRRTTYDQPELVEDDAGGAISDAFVAHGILPHAARGPAYNAPPMAQGPNVQFSMPVVQSAFQDMLKPGAQGRNWPPPPIGAAAQAPPVQGGGYARRKQQMMACQDDDQDNFECVLQ